MLSLLGVIYITIALYNVICYNAACASSSPLLNPSGWEDVAICLGEHVNKAAAPTCVSAIQNQLCFQCHDLLGHTNIHVKQHQSQIRTCNSNYIVH